MGRGHVGSKVSFASEDSVLSRNRVQTMCQLGIPSLTWWKGEAEGRGERGKLFHLSTPVKRSVEPLGWMYTEQSNVCWGWRRNDHSVCWIMREWASPRQSVRMNPILSCLAAGGWAMDQGDGQWGSRSGKDQEKKWWWEGDFDFCSIQTAQKLTAGHPGRDQGDRLSLSLGLTETGRYWRGRSELSAWNWQLNLCWQQRGDQAPIYVVL